MIFGFINQVKRKPKEFYYRPLSYDPEQKAFHEKVLERGKTNDAKRFDFRASQKVALKKEFRNRAMRFVLIIIGLLYMGYLVLSSKYLDSLAEWLVNG